MSLLLVSPVVARAQSLGALAKSEADRRKESSKTTKVYTNDTLRSDITPSKPASPPPASAEPAPAAGAPSAGSGSGAAAEAPTTEVKKDEAYWRNRITTARDQLSRAQAFSAALESQINGLTAEFMQRDDPGQRSVIEANRKKAVAEHERVRREIDEHTKAIAAVEEEARKAGVPPGWLR